MVLSQLQLGYGKTIEIRSNVVNHGSEIYGFFSNSTKQKCYDSAI